MVHRFPADLKRELVDRIVASPSFSKSDRLTTFLLHICELERSGRAREIREQRIGETIFGRSDNFDPAIDSIVRSHASRLRLRLDQYFAQDGANESIRLRIPKGAYVPLFEVVEEQKSDPPIANSIPYREPKEQSLTRLAPPPAPERAPLPFYRRAIFVLPILASLALCGVVLRRNPSVWHKATPSDLLWRTVFAPGHQTLFVVGDGGANIFQNITRRRLTPEEYSSSSWLKDPAAQTPSGYSWAPIPSRSYTPNFSVDLAILLARLPQVADGQFSALTARELRLGNLKDAQAILLGSPGYNPWEQLLTKTQNFRMDLDPVENSISIQNTEPLPGEPAVYKWSQTEALSHRGYSLITLMQNLNGTGRILLLQGTTAEGDKAAGEFLFNRALIEPILRSATTSDGRLNNFEIVLETNFVAGGNIDTHMIASRIHPLR